MNNRLTDKQTHLLLTKSQTPQLFIIADVKLICLMTCLLTALIFCGVHLAIPDVRFSGAVCENESGKYQINFKIKL